MDNGKDDAMDARRRIIVDALKAAVEHLDVPRGDVRKPIVGISLKDGQVIEARHVETDGLRVALLSATREGQFDTIVTHVDDVSAVRIVDDGKRRHIDPMNYDPARKKLIKRIIDENLYPTLPDEMNLRQLISTEEGRARIEEAAIAIGDDHLIDSVVDAIQQGRTSISELEERHRQAICRAFADQTVQKAVEASYRPYIREGEWEEEAINQMTSPQK